MLVVTYLNKSNNMEKTVLDTSAVLLYNSTMNCKKHIDFLVHYEMEI
jgi:hypothetical protein